MKLLYFGTVCERKNYMTMLETFRVKPSVAPYVFESALLKGFQENKAELEAMSFPVIPAYPHSKYLGWGTRKETMESGYQTTWIGAVNITGMKQMCQRISSHALLKKWLKKNRNEEKAVLIYSAYQPVSASIVKLCKKYQTKCYAIIPDLPRDMYAVAKVKPLKKWLSKFYVRAAEKVQGSFDGYIYLAEAMKEVIAPDTPYTVVEGIANVAEAKELMPEDKTPEFTVMYAGTLNERYGIRNLVEAFMGLKAENARLWIFGSGDFQGKIQEYAKEDSRICYFGRVSREEVLKREMQASLLVNVRDDKDEFTKYSFPSKVIEYMLSGTPMLMTRLSGIPAEYYDHAYTVEDNRVETLRAALEQLSKRCAEDLLTFGAGAQAFIRNNKNAAAQAAKILRFIDENRD